MIKLEEALQLAQDIISKKNIDSKVYQKSNEYLKYIFDNIDFSSKKILTVLSSSDQLFSFLYKDALLIDSFDINPLVEYYYYLRKWCMEEKITYPLEIKDNVIKDIIKNRVVDTKEEKWAQKFWEILYQDSFKLRQLFFKANTEYDFDYPLDIIIMNYNKLIANMEDFSKLNFFNIDVFKNFELEEKYDYIYMSNILQRAQFDEESLKICACNLDRALNNEGVVVCSNFISNEEYYKNIIECEKKIMSNFDYEEDIAYNPIIDKSMPIYYTYTKKK